MLGNNLQVALRNLLRRRTFTGINLLGLALGMAAAIFAFLWVHNEFSFDRYHPTAERLYRINTDVKISSDETWYWGATPLPLLDALQNEVPEVVRVAAISDNSWRPAILRHQATVLPVKNYAYVSEDWFEVFTHEFISGSPADFQAHLRSAILTRGFAEKLFGRWDVAGETFRFDSLDFAVQAVIENHPVNSSFRQELMLPLSYYEANPEHAEQRTWNNFEFLTFAELRAGADPAALDKKLTSLIRKYKDDESITLSVQPLADVHFDQERNSGALLTGDRQTTSTFGVIGLIILFLACVNYMSLTTAQAGMRSKEVGVRKIVGADGGHIFRLLFAESLLTTLSALVLALVIVQLALPAFNAFTEKAFRLDPANPTVWTVVVGTLLAALLLSGIYPALFLAGFAPGNFLRGRNFLQLKNTTFRKGLVVVQFAITVGLIVGALVIYRQQEFIRKKELGYDRSHVFEFQVPYDEQRPATVQALRQALAAEPGVVQTAASNGSIIDLRSSHSGSIDWDGRPEEFVPSVSQLSVDARFRELMQLQLVAGRWFEAGKEADGNNVLLNEAALRLFRMPEPVVGQKFSFHGREGQVIGIVRDFHYQNLRQEIGPLVLFSNPVSNGNILVRAREGQVAQAIAAARAAWTGHFPGQPFEYQFMDDTFDQLYKGEEKNARLFRLLAGLAVFISCLGLFGLAVFSTERRTKEIGIRKVLGASVAGIVTLLSKDFLQLVGLALLIALPVAYYLMSRWLENFAYHTDLAWWVFATAGGAALLLAFLTVSAQSVKAALATPTKSLRQE